MGGNNGYWFVREQTVGLKECMHLMALNTIGMTVLVDALLEASCYFTGSGLNGRQLGERRMQECKESLAFVQGTGLDIIVDTYQIAYDTDHLRKSFFTRMGRREYID